MLKTEIIGVTDVGKMRENNEDDFIAETIWDENHVLGVVIDGVGGYEGGEIATAYAKKTIVDYLDNNPNGERLYLLKQAVTAANNRIVEERQRQPQYAQMSCVLSACLVEVERKLINMVHIGDTRVYMFHRGLLTKLSHDHSYVGYREDVGDLSEEDAMNHPKRNEISRSLGEKLHQYDDRDFLEATTYQLLPDSKLLLCSDGLTDLVTKAEITEVLSTDHLPEQQAKTLIDLANEKSGKDNITVIIFDFRSNGLIENGVIEVEEEEAGINDRQLTMIDAAKHEPKEKRDKNGRTSKEKRRWFLLYAIIIVLFGTNLAWFFVLNNKPDITHDNVLDKNIYPETTTRVPLVIEDKDAQVSDLATIIRNLQDSIQIKNDIIVELRESLAAQDDTIR